MYTCSEVVRFIASDEYLRLGLMKRLAVRMHLAMCRHCSRYRRQLQAVGAGLRGLNNEASVPAAQIEAAKRRVLKALSQKP